MLRHGTSGFTSHPKKGVLRIFIALKNPSSLPGLNPQPLCPVASTLTTTPPRRPTIEMLVLHFIFVYVHVDVVRLCLRSAATNWPSVHPPHRLGRERNPGLLGERPATNRPSHGTAEFYILRVPYSLYNFETFGSSMSVNQMENKIYKVNNNKLYT
jgi:hypothetical protein